ncbi:hypothetical protein AB1046_11385 [Promicromonospora sp. Populi]
MRHQIRDSIQQAFQYWTRRPIQHPGAPVGPIAGRCDGWPS